MNAATPWQAGRFDLRAGKKKILFGRMYEDTSIEEAAFPEGARVFTIASAGCTALALAPGREVTAVDINPVQLEYAQARVAGASSRAGSAERVVGIGRHLMALFGWRRATLERFLSLEDPAEQLQFWHRHLNGIAFRTAVDTLLSAPRLKAVYASPLLEVLPPHFGRVMRARLERCFALHPNRTNPYARALFLGELAPVPTSEAARKIRFACADAASYLESCAPSSFDGFTLSNITDGVPAAYRARLMAAVRRAASPDAKLVLRSFGEPTAATRSNQAARDRSMLWGSVEVLPASDAA